MRTFIVASGLVVAAFAGAMAIVNHHTLSAQDQCVAPSLPLGSALRGHTAAQDQYIARLKSAIEARKKASETTITGVITRAGVQHIHYVADPSTGRLVGVQYVLLVEMEGQPYLHLIDSSTIPRCLKEGQRYRLTIDAGMLHNVELLE